MDEKVFSAFVYYFLPPLPFLIHCCDFYCGKSISTRLGCGNQDWGEDLSQNRKKCHDLRSLGHCIGEFVLHTNGCPVFRLQITAG